MTSSKLATAVLVFVTLTFVAAGAGQSSANARDTQTGRSVDCTPGKDGCLPTPIECALGGYNGHWDGNAPGRLADCVGGGGHIVHYEGGYLGIDRVHPVCGVIIDGDQATAGAWTDPNLCPPARAPRGFGVAGRAFSPGVRSRRGVVASTSPAAARAGVGVLDGGGNAADAAVATVLALGVTRPDACGLGGAGEFLYRSNAGRVGAIEFEPTAPASVTPSLYSGKGLFQADIGHRVVGVPGVPAGAALALERYGTIGWARALAPAISLAHDGVPVYTGLAQAYAFGPNIGVPINPATYANLMRLFPASALAYLRAGALPYPPDNRLARSILRVPDLERSLRQLAAHGPEAFYKDTRYADGPSIGHLILKEMKRAESSPYPGDAPSPWTASDLARYRAVERTPVTGTYRGYDVIGEPPPSIGGVNVIETLNLLEGFPLGSSIRHSSADYFHLVAEAQKIAWVDSTSYLADPAFHDNPVAALTSKAYAARRRQEIDLGRAKDYAVGSIDGVAAPSPADRGAAVAHHTTHVSVIDADGNAASFTCTLGGGFGSLVVAPGTGFFLNDLQDFDVPGTIEEARPGKRPGSTLTPTIVVRNGRAVLATGAAGGLYIPAPIALMVSDLVDYGMDTAHAVDAARSFSFCLSVCHNLEGAPPSGGLQIEDERVLPDVLADLSRRGQPIVPLGEYAGLPNVQSVGTDLATGMHEGASDPRGDRGAQAQAP